ncbi:hypothetical protein ACFSKN_15855 [Mariniflexile gromovii]|uniref:DUF4377 domain-containing protein n=1 Tax=Mariniflexile gromovii TaxID=362523 RepID=A0ABS4BYQ8_9FLAO|nr:hypothetical protein [Mariniflexile gromovii]MBP0905720.1 hypothetical protein [Mariniflexile gromovii]
MKKFLILIISISTLFSCSSDNNNISEVNIRLSNVSQYNFKNIVVNTSTGNTNFENMSSQETTNYKAFETAYRYAFVELEIDGKTYTLQPIDYVGETPLKNGNYTYQIDANDSQEQYGKLSLTLIDE